MSLWILDTDTTSLLLRRNHNVSQQVQSMGADIAISIVTAQELATIVTCNYRDFSLVPGLSITYGTLRERGLVKIESDLDLTMKYTSSISQKPDFFEKSGFFDRTDETRSGACDLTAQFESFEK
jgi:hypothetical protein